jgi:hypothetical protein
LREAKVNDMSKERWIYEPTRQGRLRKQFAHAIRRPSPSTANRLGRCFDRASSARRFGCRPRRPTSRERLPSKL